MKQRFGPATALIASLAVAITVGRVVAQPAQVPQDVPHGETTVPAPPVSAGAPPAAPDGGEGAASAGGGGAAPQRPRPPAYVPIRATDPAAVERGRALYVDAFACAACHAPDIRGTDKGNSLLRSAAVMQDAGGELIATATREVGAHRNRYNAVTDAQFADLAQFLKSFRNIGTGSVEIIKPAVFQSGDPVAGQRYFAANCASCHAVAPDQASPAANLARAGARAQPSGIEARNLQQRWLGPSTTKPTMALVTFADGQKLSGRATRINEFSLELTLADGTPITVDRRGDRPRIELTYPLAAHAALLRRISDKEIHDVTGYLVTLK